MFGPFLRSHRILRHQQNRVQFHERIYVVHRNLILTAAHCCIDKDYLAFKTERTKQIIGIDFDITVYALGIFVAAVITFKVKIFCIISILQFY